MHAGKHTPRFVWIITFITLVVALIFAADLTEWVRGGFGWRWRYIPVEFTRIIPLALLLIAYITGAWQMLRRDANRGLILAWALLGSAALAVGVAHSREGDALYTLFTRTVSEQAAGEHYYAVRLDWSNALQNWTSIMAQYGGQVGTSPPGLFLMYGVAESLGDAFPQLAETLYRTVLPYQCHNFDLLAMRPAEWSASWLGILTPLWAALSVFPIYAIARQMTGSPNSAKQATLWWALIPGMLMFATSSSTFFPFIALITFYLLLRGLDARGGSRALLRALWLTGAGGTYGIGLFLNFVFLPLAALYGFYTLVHYALVERPARKSFTTPIVVGLWFGLGALVVWGIYWLISGLTPFDLLTQALSEHLELDRPYAFWVWFHVWDWAVFTGLAFVLVWLWGFVRDVRTRVWRRDSFTHTSLLSIALVLAVLALTISGTTRGESGRIWLFLSPFAVIVAASYLARYGRRVWLILTIAQAMMTLGLAVNLEVYGTPELSLPPVPPTVQTDRSIDALFTDANGDGFRLTGWSAQVNDEGITLDLNWQGVSRPLEAYYFGITLVAPDGSTYATDAWQPVDRQFPVTCWDAGMTVGDSVTFPLPDDATAGDWWLSLGVYGDESLPFERLRVTTLTGEDSQMGLGPVIVGDD